MKRMGKHEQSMTLVLAALIENPSPLTKKETIAFIQSKGWYDLKPEDKLSYETHQYEHAWHTDIAFGKQVGVRKKLIDSFGRDVWKITPAGQQNFKDLPNKFQRSDYNVRHCYLWSPKFKKLMFPEYQPSPKDIIRPSEKRAQMQTDYQ